LFLIFLLIKMIETWFGFMLAKLEIPRRFFPWRWCFRFEESPDYEQYMKRLEAEKQKSGK